MDNCTALNWANLEWEGGVADKTWMLGLKLMKAKNFSLSDAEQCCAVILCSFWFQVSVEMEY